MFITVRGGGWGKAAIVRWPFDNPRVTDGIYGSLITVGQGIGGFAPAAEGRVLGRWQRWGREWLI